MQIEPWKEVAIDLIGPWTVKVSNRMVEFNVRMCINTEFNLVELIRIDSKTSHHIRDKFIQSWLSCNPILLVAYMKNAENLLEAHFNGSSIVLT